METELGGFVFLSVPRSHIILSRNLFKQHYTEYEIEFARVNHTAVQCVSRRYRQFRQLHLDISAYHVFLPDFPPRRWPSKLSYQHVEARRKLLERWLLAVLAHPLLRASLHAFLDLSFCPLLSEESLTAGDILVAELLRRLRSESHMKTAALKDFDVRFFGLKATAHSDRLLVLLEDLIETCVDECAGPLALHVFEKLLSRDYCKAATVAIEQLQSLSLSRLQAIHLERHVDEGRDVQVLLHTLEREFPGSLASLLNHDLHALQQLQQWQSSPTDSPLQQVSRWKSADSRELDLRYRLIGQDLEVETRVVLKAGLEKVLDTLLQPTKRKMWDLRLAEVRIVERSREFVKFYCESEISAVRETWVEICKVQHPSIHKAVLTFQSDLRNAFVTVVELRQVSHSRADTEAEENTPTFYLSEDEEPYPANCEVVSEERMARPLARLFLSELDEAELLCRSWGLLKRVAEDSLEEAPEPSLQLPQAVQRKSLHHTLRLKEEPSSDIVLLRLSRRMFTSS